MIGTFTTMLGGLASAIYIKKEAEVNEIEKQNENLFTKDEGKLNVMPKSRLNLFSVKDKETLSQKRKDQEPNREGNLNVDIVETNYIKLNEPTKANYIQEGNRQYNLFGLEEQSQEQSKFYKSKDFYKQVDNQKDLSKLNKLKKPRKLNDIDSNENMPNIHRTQLKSSRIIY